MALYSTSALNTGRVDTGKNLTAMFDTDEKVCPTVTELRDIFGRPLSHPFQYYGYGQSLVPCMPNELVTDMKDEQRDYVKLGAPRPPYVYGVDGKPTYIGGSRCGVPMAQASYDPLGARRDASLAPQYYFARSSEAAPGVDPATAGMDHLVKIMQSKDAPVDFL